MTSKSRTQLADRVTSTAESLLASQDCVTPIDVLVHIGWLPPTAVRQWQQGRVECLEETMQVQAKRILHALELLRSWATAKGLVASEGEYVARSPQRESLRFSQSGDAALEHAYRTHWLPQALSEKKRARVVKKANPSAELVVIQARNDWACHRCGGSGDLLIMEKPGPSCLPCAGLGDLVFLAAGDPALTRRAKAKSDRYAVVVRFSKTRGRYERQGLLIEPAALEEAERGLSKSG